MNRNVDQHSVSVEANLLWQVKPRSGGRSQNEALARGMSV